MSTFHPTVCFLKFQSILPAFQDYKMTQLIYYYCVNFASEDFTWEGGGIYAVQLINLFLKLFNGGNFFDVVRY